MHEVDSYLAKLDPADRRMVDALRQIVMDSTTGLTESIKWNAPNFARDDQDRITLGLDRKGGARVVLHRGVKAEASAGVRFDDPAALAKWPSPDRGVILFGNLAEIQASQGALADLCARWVAS